MPRWLEDEIARVGSRAETTTQIGTTQQTRNGSGSQTDNQNGSESRNTSGSKSGNNSKTSTQTETGSGVTNDTGSESRAINRQTDTTQKDESSTTTRAAYTELGTEANAQTSVQTELQDAGGTISFSVPLRGGLGNTGSNPEI